MGRSGWMFPTHASRLSCQLDLSFGDTIRNFACQLRPPRSGVSAIAAGTDGPDIALLAARPAVIVVAELVRHANRRRRAWRARTAERVGARARVIAPAAIRDAEAVGALPPAAVAAERHSQALGRAVVAASAAVAEVVVRLHAGEDLRSSLACRRGGISRATSFAGHTRARGSAAARPARGDVADVDASAVATRLRP